MICFPNTLPNIIWSEQRLVPLSEGWLAETLEDSASRAGYAQWEYSPHVARALAQYLEEECRATALSVDDIEVMIRRSLAGIGFEDVAGVAELSPPRVNIFLPELAAQTGYELLFYPSLRERLQEATRYQVRGVRLVGLRDCAKMLDAAQRWRANCRRVSAQIVSFSRRCLEDAGARLVEMAVAP